MAFKLVPRNNYQSSSKALVLAKLQQHHHVMGETVSQTAQTMRAQGANQVQDLFSANLQYGQQIQLPKTELLLLAHQEDKFHKTTDKWENCKQYGITIYV